MPRHATREQTVQVVNSVKLHLTLFNPRAGCDINHFECSVNIAWEVLTPQSSGLNEGRLDDQPGKKVYQDIQS